MPRNIDDDDDDISFGGATEATLRYKWAQQASAGNFASMKKFGEVVDRATKEMEKIASNISGSKTLFGPNVGQSFEKFQKDIEEQLKKKISSGSALAKIEGDIYQVTDMRLKSLQKIAKQEKMSAERRTEIENVILKELERQQIYARDLTKAQELYGTAVKKISSFLGGGSISRAFESWAGKHETAVTGKMASQMGEGKGFGAAMEQVAGSLSKVAPLMIVIGGAVVFLITRLKALFESEVALNSEIVKATGAKTGTDIFSARIDSAAGILQKSMGMGIPESKAKAVEAAGGLVKSFGDLKSLSQTNLNTVVALQARMGISADEAASMVMSLERGAGLTADKIQPLFAEAAAASVKYAIGLNTILKDVADNASLLKLNTNGTADAFIRAAVNARQMGTTLESQQETAKGFATWEGAASKAIQLSFLTGKRFNALQLYTQANFGNSLDMQEQLLKSVKSTFFDPHTSRIRREMIAQQIGLGSAAEMEKRYSAMKEEANIQKDVLRAFGAGGVEQLGKTENLEWVRTAVRMRGTGLSKGDLEAEAMRLKQLSEKAAGEKKDIAASLGLRDLVSPTDFILGKIFNSIDKVLMPIVRTAVHWLEKLANSWVFGGEEEVPTAENTVIPTEFANDPFKAASYILQKQAEFYKEHPVDIKAPGKGKLKTGDKRILRDQEWLPEGQQGIKVEMYMDGKWIPTFQKIKHER
jgi:hypothetical protein